MSRKDYVLIARVMHAAYSAVELPVQRDALIVTIDALALELQRDNPRFDIARFRRAALTGEGLPRR